VVVKYGGKTSNGLNIHNEEIQSLSDSEEVIALPYDIPIVGYAPTTPFSVITLRLWTTKESPRNFQIQSYNAGRLDQAAENTLLTDVLYPSDHHETGKRIRLKQEFLMVSASVQDIIRHYLSTHDNFREFANKVRIQINDTHPALVIAELIRLLTKRHDIPWKTALDMTQQCLGYTNHTILSEALEQWDIGLMNYLLPRQTKIIERINQDFCNQIRAKFPNDEDRIRRMSILEKGRVRMANLAIVGSHKVNGVAKLHTDILKNSVFKDFYELYPEKFINVTNGVTQRRWLLDANPDLSKFITKRIGPEWITDYDQILKLDAFADDIESKTEVMQVKRRNKLRLIEFIQKENKIRNARGEITEAAPLIEIDSLFDVQVKRIHEYKRQLMNALHMIMLYNDILEEPNHNRIKRTIIVGGKAAAGYETAKDIIRFICAIARKINHDSRIGSHLKIVYIENYNVSKAEIIIPAADLSEQISTAGTEASGTGNMKFAMNGALTIGTDDGANIEMREMIQDEWWPFKFGASAQEISDLKASGTYSPQAILEQNPKMKKAVESLRDRTFAINDTEHQVFEDLYKKIVEGVYGSPPDRYFILKDLWNYYETQKRVEELYNDPEKWAQYVIHNIARTRFSSDTSVLKYSAEVWGLKPRPPDKQLEEEIRYEYNLIDQCRIK
jgi:starch phosphorylase